MLIRYPTGFYSTVLPQNPDDIGDVTFLISNTLPPRSDLLYPKVPGGVVSKHRQPNEIMLVDRRETFGNLVFSVSRATRKEEGNNVKQFETGQVLDFNEKSGREVNVMLVSDVTELRHDTNILDYAQMGLTSEEEQAIAELSLLTQDQLTNKLNELKQLRGDAEQVINTQQKLINDTTKTIDSLTVTLEENPASSSVATEISIIEQLILKLKMKRDSAFAVRDQAVSDANYYADEAVKVLDQLRAVGVLVK